jgi:hypothetical protein
MAGKIIADTLETGAGADIATSYVVNGSAKAWVNFNGTGTIAARDSLNLSSLTDNGTALYTNNLVSSFNYSNNYIVMSANIGESGAMDRGVSGASLLTTNIGSSGVPSNQNAGSYQIRYSYGSTGSSNGSRDDHGVIHSMALGDLA